MTSRRCLMLLACVFIAACEPTAPLSAPTAASDTHASSGPSLIQCPSNQTSSATGLVTPLGGIVSLDGHSIRIPGAGLLDPTEITITEPASQYMEIGIQAGDTEHFVFERHVLVTISYARCNRGDIDRQPLQVWYIDPVTYELLENMNGVDNKLLRTVSFWTTHLSGYAIAE
jgi:hypothetical protein